jgi:D-serine deaminase-like pyridoxal phosphate-dependent protein
MPPSGVSEGVEVRILPRDPALLRAAAYAARYAPALVEKDQGAGGHDAYFERLQAALKRADVFRPVVVIDIERMASNIAAIRRAFAQSTLALRIVTKSLQSPRLLSAVLAGAGTNRLMAFNGIMLDDLVSFRPNADVLLGKPLPAGEVADFVRRHSNSPAPAARPQWLADSARRIAQLAEIARATNAPMRISLEIDVGLHRGGLPDAAALAVAVDLVKNEPRLKISGLMGYDAHIGRATDPSAAVTRVTDLYGAAVKVLREKLGDVSGMLFNTAGSLTFPMHVADKVANDGSVGSAFVKPANFDTPALAELKPAGFIAQPVLKTMDPAIYPGREPLGDEIVALDPNARRGFFLYGGYGDDKIASPAGVRFSKLWGGRGMLSGSARVRLAEDDFVFLRPRESEGSFLQFGDIAVYDGEEIAAWWPTFRIQP